MNSIERTSTVENASPTNAKEVPNCIITLPVLAKAGHGLFLSTTGTSPQFDDMAPKRLPVKNPDPKPTAILVVQSFPVAIVKQLFEG